jgi:hypothetical protein
MSGSTESETQEAMRKPGTLSQADEYCRWLCSRVSSHSRSLEIGAGIGTLLVTAHLREYHPTDVDSRQSSGSAKNFLMPSMEPL